MGATANESDQDSKISRRGLVSKSQSGIQSKKVLEPGGKHRF